MNTQINITKLSIKNFFSAHTFIKKHKLGKYYLYISIFAIALSLGMLSGGVYFSNKLILSIQDFSIINSLEEWIKNYTSTNVDTYLYWTLFILIEIPVLITSLLIYPTILSIISFPILDSLTEKVNNILFDQKVGPSFSMQRFGQMLFKITLPNAIKTITYSLILMPFTFIPIIGFFFMFLSMCINGYFYGYDILDNYFENWNVNIDKSKRFIQSHKTLTTTAGFGGGILAMIPIVGSIFSPIISVVATGLTLKELNIHDEITQP
ncbi:EI24 domain-containing protein [Flammeovirga kamogawensis]|uniref:EI24 domain-containing protein n=1 Tax=Flammeovirga kamogawensis TaxID=373891 RepID=A0ABX8GTE8_9BACT|nr:EI24 domain-containing protein [Flammeovirga kamogawensis]MBB6460086.1 uncharacterized protein involved in cysteine biosynthesis [Flammeovirga kamogawensis]QWG06870.1 EI24 domain-containing protein [Flammeovirga kamogawensis]TRX68692.1 EI24 domain-containing protein [Flammeovirga kamogawensis]